MIITWVSATRRDTPFSVNVMLISRDAERGMIRLRQRACLLTSLERRTDIRRYHVTGCARHSHREHMLFFSGVFTKKYRCTRWEWTGHFEFEHQCSMMPVLRHPQSISYGRFPWPLGTCLTYSVKLLQSRAAITIVKRFSSIIELPDRHISAARRFEPPPPPPRSMSWSNRCIWYDECPVIEIPRQRDAKPWVIIENESHSKFPAMKWRRNGHSFEHYSTDTRQSRWKEIPADATHSGG